MDVFSLLMKDHQLVAQLLTTLHNAAKKEVKGEAPAPAGGVTRN